MKRFLVLVTLALMVRMGAYGQVPQKITYQGMLTMSPGGAPLPNGNYQLKFEIYNLPTGGTLRYSDVIKSSKTDNFPGS